MFRRKARGAAFARRRRWDGWSNVYCWSRAEGRFDIVHVSRNLVFKAFGSFSNLRKHQLLESSHHSKVLPCWRPGRVSGVMSITLQRSAQLVPLPGKFRLRARKRSHPLHRNIFAHLLASFRWFKPMNRFVQCHKALKKVVLTTKPAPKNDHWRAAASNKREAAQRRSS